MKTPVVVAYIAAYVFLDWVSYVHPVLPLGITPWNPPPGLSVFLLLRYGTRYWPALFVAALAADIVVRDAPAQILALISTAAVIAAAYVAAATILVRLLRMRINLDTARDLGMFFAVIVPTTLAVAVAFVAIYTLQGSVPREEFLANVTRYWVGDLIGILVLAPALLSHTQPGSWLSLFSRGPLLEWTLQALGLLAAFAVVSAVAARFEFQFFSPLFLPLIWIGARWGLRGATLALAALQLGLIVIAKTGGYQDASFVQLQFVMLALATTGLVLGAVVTQRKQIEASLHKKQEALNRALQLAAAGEMTSALAHELNQPIAALSNYLGACQLLVQTQDRERLEETMGKALIEARRASDVVHRLRDFFRTGNTQRESISALRIIEDAVKSVRRRADLAGIRVSVNAEPDLPLVAVDPLQIESALQNLLANAVDALGGGRVGQRDIEVSARRATAGIEISIRDSGPGIAPEIAAHLFEPFNTTKADGMGMGLAISRTFVTANGGELLAEPGTTAGATFILKLPAARPGQGGEHD